MGAEYRAARRRAKVQVSGVGGVGIGMVDGGFGYGGLLTEAGVHPRPEADTLRPSRGRHVIFGMHTCLRAPVAQPDRAAAF
jgi:hypothetical protein